MAGTELIRCIECGRMHRVPVARLAVDARDRRPVHTAARLHDDVRSVPTLLVAEIARRLERHIA